MTTHDETHRRQRRAGFENARVNLEGVFQTVREPLVVLDDDMRIQLVNRAFCNTFQVSESETLGQRLDELGNGQWNIPGLRTLLHEIVSQNSSFEDFEVEHPFPTIGLKTMLLNARQIELDGHGTHLILLAIEDISARKQAENALVLQPQISGQESASPLVVRAFGAKLVPPSPLRPSQNEFGERSGFPEQCP